MARIRAGAARPVADVGTVASRIRELETELQQLRRQQRDDLLRLITDTFPPGDVFSAFQIWQLPALRSACVEANIGTVKQLGVWLRSWCGTGLARICRDGDGIVWSVSVADLHDDTRLLLDED